MVYKFKKLAVKNVEQQPRTSIQAFDDKYEIRIISPKNWEISDK